MEISQITSRRIVLTILVAAATAFFGPTAIGTSMPAWKKFELESKGLSVLMPGTPMKKEIHSKSFIGDITTFEYFVDDGLDSYSVETTDLPGFAVSFSGSKTIYEHAKGSLLKKTLSKSISFTDISLNGMKGKRLVYDTPTKPDHPEMQGEARFFLIGDRLYIANAVVEMSGGDGKLEHFFSSLDIRK